MRDILFTLISMFVAGNVLTEWRNRKTLPWRTTPLSGYLAGVPLAWVQDIGFLALAAAMLILGGRVSGAGIAFFAGALAVILVIATKYAIVYGKLTPEDTTIVTRFHVYSAGIAYTGLATGLLMKSWHSPGLANGAAMAAVAVAFLVNRFAPNNTKLEEASVAACLMVSLYAWVLT